MIQNTVSYFIPFFKTITFFYKNIWLCNIFLKKNFAIVIPIASSINNLKIKKFFQFNKFVLKTFSQHWFRISFRGKGFRLRKFKHLSKLTLNFGHSHWARVALSKDLYFLKKIRRQNYLCVTRFFSNYKNLKKDLKKYKTLNKYTKRGLRLRKQFIFRRFGKISQVVSSLH